MAVLAKKAADRKAKRIASLVVGDEPSVAWGEDVVRLRYLVTSLIFVSMT